MAFEFIITSDAEDDLRDITQYYLHAGKPVASNFAKAFTHTAVLICEYPEIGTLTKNGIRRKLISGYPYSIYYKRNTDDKLLIVALLHFRRNPKNLTERFESL